MITKFNDYIKENKEYLSYDEIDLDEFTNRYFVGRWFKSKEEAYEYLVQILKNNKSNLSLKNRTTDDFIVGISTLYKNKKINDGESVWQIYPKPTQEQLNRNLASEYIKKYGILSTPDLRYIHHPLYAYLENKHKSKLKELGVYYQFKPLKEINLIPVLQRIIKEKIGGSLLIKNDEKGRTIIQFYGRLNDKTMFELQEFGEKLIEIVKEFNTMIGTY